jgi:hypothetical protein
MSWINWNHVECCG